MRAFTFNSQPARVIFGDGALANLPDELARLEVKKVLVLSTRPQQLAAQSIADQIGARAAGVFAGAVMHVPIESAQKAVTQARHLQADCLLAVGGGSTTGLAKAMALQIDLPIVAIPTTYAGSKMTPIFGITEAGLKKVPVSSVL
ncbi:MAG TPA: iron-containing alcohol dehydrogenase [Castellaniella sp.]|uniref:iron-containing alcohol dehydrogenase n=1 Tax=Castellaniella sp. TaxID=1955812 RepID=UPI002F0274AF